MEHDHLPGLMALLLTAPLAVLTLGGTQLAANLRFAPATWALARASAAPASARLASLLLLLAGAVHAGLIPGHLEEPMFAVAFLAAAVTMVGAAVGALITAPWWKPVSAGLLLAALAVYVATRIAGIEAVDSLGVATTIVEVTALAVVLAPSSRGQTHVA